MSELKNATLDTWMIELARLYPQIVEGAPEAIIVADHAGVIRFWNAAAQELFGYSAAEALGQSLDLIVPAPQRARHWDGYRTVMQTGVTRYGRELLAVPAVRKDGARVSVEFYVVLLRDANGGIEGIAALMRDVTSRWHQDRATRQRLAALEAQVAELTSSTRGQGFDAHG
jgi:PAS domain S-box-containing protein